MSVYEHTFEEIWNSENMRDVRKKMIAGEKVDQCYYCYVQESSSPPSLRMELNPGFERGWGNPYGQTIEKLKADAIANDFRVPGGPAWVGVELGNLCNLKCRMCSTTWSSSIAGDPVHSRWSTRDVPVAVRWQGRAMVILPLRVLGIDYDGVSALDQTGPTAVAWVDGVATVDMSTGGGEAVSVHVRLSGTEAPDCEIQICANDVQLFSGKLSRDAFDRTFELPRRSADVDALSLRFECSSKVGIEEIKLLKAGSGRAKVGVSRFSSGKQWFQEPEFLENDLLYKADSITKLNMIGGEPLLIKEARTVMQQLIRKGVAKNICLVLATNGTVASDEICDLVSQFRSHLIGVSLDGVGAVNSYVRYGSRWEELAPNIRRLQQIPNGFVYVNMTVQAYNMLHVAPMAQFVQEFPLGFRYHYLIGPAHLGCVVMPVEARKEAARRITAYVTQDAVKVRPGIRRPMLDLARILESDETPVDPNLLDEFMLFTNDLDASRGQSFASINPELMEYIRASGVQWNDATRFYPALKSAGVSRPNVLASDLVRKRRAGSAPD